MKKNKFSKNWVIKQRRDFFFKKSKLEGYRSRAVYKLQEIDKKYKIFKNGQSIIDLGASPGSWSQFVSKKVKNGKIISIDIKEMNKIPNTFQIIGDFLEIKYQNEITKCLNNKKVDLVLSDMANNTSGNKNLDAILTGELCLEAMRFANQVLKKDGKFISKFFMGSIFKEISLNAKKYFKVVNIFKPLSSKKDSKENFIICKFMR